MFFSLLNKCCLFSGSPYNKVTDVSEYDYDGAQDDIQENDADNEIKHWETPVFTTNPQTLLVNEGDTIRWGLDTLKAFESVDPHAGRYNLQNKAINN